MSNVEAVPTVREAPLRIEQFDGESAHATLCRLAFRHRFGSTTSFLHSLGLRGSLLQDARTGRKIDEIARIARHDERVMRHWTIQDVDGGLKLARERIGTTASAHHWMRYGRICPRCFAVDLQTHEGPDSVRAYQRSWWDLASVGHCWLHRIELLDHCPRCSARLGMPYADRSRCHQCGCNLADVHTPDVDEALLRAERYLLGRLDVCARDPHPVLDGLAFCAASNLLQHLGRLIIGVPGGSPARSRTVTLAAGLGALQDWPNRFVAELEEASGKGLISKGADRSRYRNFEVIVRSNATSWGIIASVFQAHADTSVIRPRKRPSDLGEELRWGWRTTGSLAKEFNCGRRVLAEVAKALGVVRDTSDWSRVCYVGSSDVIRIRDYLASMVTKTEAAKVLGISYRELAGLVTHGHLKLASDSGTRCIPRYRRLDVDRLAGRFLGCVQAVARHDLLTVRQAAESFRCRALLLVLAILDGEIAVCAGNPGSTGLDAALLRREEVSLFLRGTAVAMLSLKQAAKRSNISELLLRASIRAGMLRYYSHSGDKPTKDCVRSSRLVLASDVDSLRKRVTTTSDLAIRFNSSLDTVRSVLDAAGVEAVCRAQRQCIYERNRADDVLTRWWERRNALTGGSASGPRSVVSIPEHNKLTDAEWERLAALVPRRRRGGSSARNVVDIVMFKFSFKLTWADIPSGKEIYATFYVWARLGVWDRVCSQLRKISPQRDVPVIVLQSQQLNA